MQILFIYDTLAATINLCLTHRSDDVPENYNPHSTCTKKEETSRFSF